MSGRDWAAGGVDGLVDAVRKGHPRHVQLLLEAGTPVDDHDHTGSTALVAAVLSPLEDRLRERLMRLLLQAGADPNVGDARGTTPIMHAAINNLVPALVFLLQQSKVDLSLQDGDGNSALMYAAAFGHREVVLLILAAFKKLHHVAVQGQRNGQGLTAWQLAEKNGHEDIAALLKVESQVFGKPAGPSAFVPAHPLDLDRPPTPTEVNTVRSSSRRLKSSSRSNSVPPAHNPTAPLPPTYEDQPCLEPTSLTSTLRSSCKERQTPGLGSGKPETGSRRASVATSLTSTSGRKKEVNIQPSDIENLIGGPSVAVRTAALSRSCERSNADSQHSRDLSISKCRANRQLGTASSLIAGRHSFSRWSRDKESFKTSRRKEETSEEPGDTPSNTSKNNKVLSRTESLVVTAPDPEERAVLDELMKDLAISCSPGSGNEADTESLMECERPSREDIANKMSGPNNRKMTVPAMPLTVAALTSHNESMPKIDLSSSSRSLNRSIQHLVQEDTEIRPGQRPPTPARPSLPTLLPGRYLDVSLNTSTTSTKSEGRYAVPSRRVSYTTFPRSSSEPRSLTSSPKPHQSPENDYDDDSDDHSSDILDSSTRSEGWDHVRGSRGRGPSEGHVVTLPPINQAKGFALGVQGRKGLHGIHPGGLSTHGENVLSVAKKTLEQLESVLAPSEASSLARSLPRTRATQQIHLET